MNPGRGTSSAATQFNFAITCPSSSTSTKPMTIKKAVRDLITISQAAEPVTNKVTKDLESMDRQELEKLVKELTKKMNQAAAELNFEEAVVLRDRMVEVKKMLLDLENP